MSTSVTAKPPRDVRGIALGVGAVLVVTAVAVAATFGLAVAFDVDFDALSRDPTTVYKGPVYAGWFSNLVVLLWQVPATCALLTAAVLRSTRRGGAPMFLAAGLLTAVLAVDDLFLIHESLAEAIRLPQLVLPVVYGVAVGAFAWVFRRGLGTGIVFLALALACWTGSVAVAVFANQHGQLVVSAAKFAGVGFWTLLIVRLAMTALREGVVVAEDGQDAPDEAPAVEASAVEERRRGAGRRGACAARCRCAGRRGTTSCRGGARTRPSPCTCTCTRPSPGTAARRDTCACACACLAASPGAGVPAPPRTRPGARRACGRRPRRAGDDPESGGAACARPAGPVRGGRDGAGAGGDAGRARRHQHRRPTRGAPRARRRRGDRAASARRARPAPTTRSGTAGPAAPPARRAGAAATPAPPRAPAPAAPADLTAAGPRGPSNLRPWAD